MLRSFLVLTLVFAMNLVNAQESAYVAGVVSNKSGNPKESVNIGVLGLPVGTSSAQDGSYKLAVPSDTDIVIVFSFIGFGSEKVQVNLAPGETYNFNQTLKVSSTQLQNVTVEDKQIRNSTLQRIDPKTIRIIPTATGGVEAIIKTLPGVSSNNELTSQYSVRGGNYDENLVYVNDILIYRPFLVRSGEQEGLSFINSDMVSSILFSAGGFDAKYGDKMSSVLDIRYRKPTELGGTVSMSLLGGAAHVEGVTKNYRLSYQLGLRHKTNQYLLNSLNTKGEYKPSFTDFQGLFTFSVNEDVEISFLGNYARNRYTFIPENRETKFGTLNEALQLKIYFDGQEVDAYETFQGALSTTIFPKPELKIKIIAAGFRTFESETYDIQGQYFLDELEKDIGKEDFGEAKLNRGIGTYLNHARNYLDATVYSLEQKGYFTKGIRYLQWGVKYQREQINDKLSEWTMIDSAGYSIPKSGDSVGYVNPSLQPVRLLEIQDVLKAKTSLNSNRLSGYLQNNWLWATKDSLEFSLTTGMRASYWDLNEQILFSPRLSFSVQPNWKSDFVFRAAFGFYQQAPFYRELRDLNGEVHTDVKAQESIHVIVGSDYNFRAWNRPFKLVTELYYKHMENLIPYEIDNVRIRYYAENNARGYATGIDLKVNGEFVKGIESWVSLSVMQTQEDIIDDYYYDYYNQEGEKIIVGYTADQTVTDSIRFEPGYIPRPTDQRVNFSLFFQDYLPKRPDIQMHLNLVYGSGLPFGPPSFQRYKDTLRIPAYRRVDIGFSARLLKEGKKVGPKNPLKHFKTIWLSLEVFNLLGINNTISYLWVSDVTNRQYAVPNFLTQRLLNLKLIVKF
ncbi:MAG TPA: TonB-dependent receptor [Flavobacteriales bacterium]|nr:TonB-dependent receptor [Flavobacteriales bacterium]